MDTFARSLRELETNDKNKDVSFLLPISRSPFMAEMDADIPDQVFVPLVSTPGDDLRYFTCYQKCPCFY